MRDPHAFRNTGRAGGVHHIGVRRAGLGQLRIVRGRCAQVEQIHVQSCSTIGKRLVATTDDPARCAFIENLLQTLVWRLHIQRQIRCGTFVDGQLRDHQLQRTWKANAHVLARPYSQADQVMRKLIGLAVERCITAPMRSIDHGWRLRRQCRLLLEQRMHGLCMWIVAIGGVEGVQQLSEFVGRQHAQLTDRQVRALLERIDQLRKCALHESAHAFGTDVRTGLHAQRELVSKIIHAQQQRIIGALAAAKCMHAMPGSGCRRVCR